MGAEWSEKWVQHWLAAMRWRRRVDVALARVDLSFSQWLVLDSIAALHRQTSDAVSQIQVARRLELGPASVSRLMTVLEQRGLVDRAPAYPTTENRIYLTNKGKHLVAQGQVVVEMVSGTAR
jgi:DNA-binding MarR family transcriptional regulator